jgi:hypothetical protein
VETNVVLEGDYGPPEFDRLCETLAPLTGPAAAEGVAIDLSRLTALSASCSALLVATLRTSLHSGLCDPMAQIVLPTSQVLACWLNEDNLHRLLEHPADGAAPVGQAFGCVPFSSTEAIFRARESLLAIADAQDKLDEQARLAIKKMIWDFTQNVLAHADIGGGVACARIDEASRTLELAVADRGIGVRASLARGGEAVASDADALAAALRPGVTSEPGTGKGFGLFLSMLTLLDNGGTLMLRSGVARLRAPRTVVPQPPPAAAVGGTVVTALVRLDHPLNSREVEEALQSPAGVVS